ncbi:MAG: hypothetical protein AAGG48_29925 [Planctomycetota bacterium]
MLFCAGTNPPCPAQNAEQIVSVDQRDPAALGSLFAHHRDSAVERVFDVNAGLQPLWTFHGGAIYLDRVTEDSRVLMQNVASPGEQLNASDFDFDWTVGFDASITRRWWDNDGFEYRVLYSNQLDAGVSVPATATSLQINSSPPVFVPDVSQMNGRYETDLSSFEINYHHWIARYATGILGIRYAALDDDLDVLLTSAPVDAAYNVRTRNDLYGAQVGIIGGPRLCWSRAIVSGSAKLGVYGNDASHRSLLDTGAAQFPIRASADNLSWLAEANAQMELPLTRCLSLTAGYTVIWIDQVAIASDQLLRSDFFNGTGKSEKGTAVFHGVITALEWRY